MTETTFKPAALQTQSTELGNGPVPLGWLERRLKPTKISARYPFKGKALLYTTCAFASLGDGLHGYDSGKRILRPSLMNVLTCIGIMAGLLINPVFIKRFFSDYMAADGTIDPSITGIAVSGLQLAAALGALVSGRLGDIMGRRQCVRIGGILYFLTAFIQMFAPNFAAVSRYPC